MRRARGGGGICIKFDFPRSTNFSITRLKLKSATLSDELKLTMFITFFFKELGRGTVVGDDFPLSSTAAVTDFGLCVNYTLRFIVTAFSLDL
jgi:hypothetical protein